MKEIKVSDEMYDSLMELSKEINSQDHRGTRMPYIFQIQTKEEVAAYPGNGESIWVDMDGAELRTDDDIKNHIAEYIYENDESINHLDDVEAKSIATIRVEEMDEFQKENWLESHEFRRVEVTTNYKYENAFFTAKACKEHIRLNHYHYKEPTDYLSFGTRNPELELVFQFLCELSGGKLHT